MSALMADILIQILNIIHGLLSFYTYIVIFAVLMTWINPDPYNQIVRTIRMVTDPVLGPARRLMYPLTRNLGIDLSPILVIMGITIVQTIIVHLQRSLYTPVMPF